MAKRPFLKTVVTSEKIVFELSLQSVQKCLDGWNQMGIEANRQHPKENWPLVRLTDGQAFMKLVAKRLTEDRDQAMASRETLPKIMKWAVEDAVEIALKRKAGIVRVPSGR